MIENPGDLGLSPQMTEEFAVINSLRRKLRPSNFSTMSPKMAAIVGCIVGEQNTDPYLVQLTVTSDGFLMGMESGDIGFNAFLGTKADLYRNWTQLIDVAGLDENEAMQANIMFLKAIGQA